MSKQNIQSRIYKLTEFSFINKQLYIQVADYNLSHMK